MDDKTKNILGNLSPVYGLLSGQGAFGKLAPIAGMLPMKLAQNREEEEEKAKAAAAGGMKKGGSVKSSVSSRADGIAMRGKTKGRFV